MHTLAIPLYIFNTKLALRAINSILHRTPVAATFFLTNRCNFRCDFCHYPHYNNDKAQELTISQIDALFGKLARAGVVMVAMIGGEPFVRKDIYEAVQAISKHMIVQITTNGWFIDDAAAERIFGAGAYMVSVSLDSSDPEVHNSGRGNPRSFDRVIRALEALKRAPKIAEDQLVCIESVLSGRNVQQAEQMIQLAESLGVKIVFQPFSAGHLEVNLEEMSSIDGDITRQFLELKERYESLYNNLRMIAQFTPYFRDGRIPGCQAGRTYFNVDAYGNITRCEEQRRSYGNAKIMRVPQIRAALRQIYADTQEDGCDTCYLRTRGETEPLYQDDFQQLVIVAQEMFGIQLPALIPRVAGVPGVKPLLRATLQALSPLL